jgi:hypothetical protein
MHRRLANAFLFACTAAALGQIVHLPCYTFNGDSLFDLLGYSVSGAGDVNKDGVPDFIAGAPNANGSGMARVYSGADGSVLYTFHGDSAGDQFGHSVSGAGDVNNDGFDDLIVGAPQDDNNGLSSGSARVFSGATGSILYSINGGAAFDFFGYSVSGAGDSNSDNFDDFIVGATSTDVNGSGSGSAVVYSGATGAILYTFNGDSSGDNFGHSVSCAGDVNGDNRPDIIVGAPFDDNTAQSSGSARVFSGANGSILYTFNGVAAFDNMGSSVSGAGDVNNDGFDDLIVNIDSDTNGFDSGAARVFSGADGSILYTFNGGMSERFGFSVSGAGDVDNDGFADLIVGTPFASSNGGQSNGLVRVFSGADGSTLYTFIGDPGDSLGFSVSGAADVNNDGYADFIVGATGDDNDGARGGSAIVFCSTELPTPCPGDTNDDDLVNFTDLNAVLAAFGQTGEGLAADLNDDGVVNFTDLNEVLANFGVDCSG